MAHLIYKRVKSFCSAFWGGKKNIEKILAWIEIKSGQHLREDFLHRYST